MSIVTVQLGQCGNQVGFEVFDALYSDSYCSQGLCSKKENEAYQASCKERFFSEEENGVLVARSVLVDMEPKVINQTLSKAAQSGRWKYGQHACFCQKQGSGNNWAYGYSCHGPKHEESIMNLIRKEVEKCDSLHGFSIIMSMAGGTGSGLGAFITQNLQDQYPNALKMNQVIWPYGTGEVIVQNYNSILTLSHLYRCSDALLVHENDAIHKICAKMMNIRQISFNNINQVLAHQLGSMFQPTYSAEDSFHYRRNPLGDLMEHLVPHPEFKMLGVRNIPQMAENSLPYSTFTWAGLLKHLRQMLISNAKMEEGIDWQVRPPLARLPALGKMPFNKELHFDTSIANLVILRGKDVHCADLGKRMLQWKLRSYVYQYTKFGIEEEDFLDSFSLLEQVIASYCNL
ncbi:PREDICTED: tubulin delta chain isoform X2 [Chrysochloris asiatica]|uniref:Tubulin delta chain n=1 Tax=Chrysochloris asiatica TaxID=185453 RepID=A0A9B0WHI5_CHRAS|nr:PREDICTED: tubulin delta chain isoform X2 [Chrysochloris asiatica]